MTTYAVLKEHLGNTKCMGVNFNTQKGRNVSNDILKHVCVKSDRIQTFASDML